jgi:hydrogenase small subunit
MSAQDCTGCIESFIRSAFVNINDLLQDLISLEYSELLSIASGEQLEKHKDKVIEENKGEYILIIEGSIPESDDFLTIGGHSFKEDILHAARHAKAILAFGSCSSWGGIAAASPNPTGAVPITELIKDVPIALIPGCPPIAEIMVGTLLHIHTHGCLPELDKKGRPKKFYQYTVHQQCHRKPFFDQKLFVESYDDEGAHKDYCLFKLGCRGPSTFNSCECMGWNGGLGSPIMAGAACIGCSEKGFWDKGTLCSRKTKV